MKTFNFVAAQGEITIRRLGDVGCCGVPAGCTRLTTSDRLVIGHSETGHNHVLSSADDVMVLDRPLDGMRVLYAILKEPASLDHCRDFDRHDPIALSPGEYEFRIAREYDPWQELARLSAD